MFPISEAGKLLFFQMFLVQNVYKVLLCEGNLVWFEKLEEINLQFQFAFRDLPLFQVKNPPNNQLCSGILKTTLFQFKQTADLGFQLGIDIFIDIAFKYLGHSS
jgi:hypothetical protein